MEVRMKNTCPSKFLPFFPVNRNQASFTNYLINIFMKSLGLFKKLLIEIKH